MPALNRNIPAYDCKETKREKIKMVNGINSDLVKNLTTYKLEKLISPKQIYSIVESTVNSNQYSLEQCILKRATEGLAGYLGDHLRLSIIVRLDRGKLHEIKLFIKCMPNNNQPKVDFLKNNLFYKRESFMFNELFKGLEGNEEPNPWRPNMFICNDEILVMPDMAVSGYTMRDKMLYYDLDHCLLTLTAMGKLHAASVNYETNKIKTHGCKYRIVDEFGDIFGECAFKDTPWLRAGARTTAHFLGTFSKKYNYNSEHFKKIESALEDIYIATCYTSRVYENTVNVVIHKDLWSNNVLFKYEDVTPINALLIDFQCISYVPPAFDVNIFLYLNTSRSFRGVYDRLMLRHYYNAFIGELSPASKDRLQGYTFENFLHFIDLSKAFGLLVSVMIFPYIMMDPLSAKKHFDNPDTYEFYNNVDRSEPVIGQAKKDDIYREKILKVCEEFVEKYVL